MRPLEWYPTVRLSPTLLGSPASSSLYISSFNPAHHDASPLPGRVGVEFDAPAVTSPGFAEDIYSQFQKQVGGCGRTVPLLACRPTVP